VLGASDACANCAAGELLIANNELTAFGISKLGTQFTVKTGSPQQALSPGTFYPIELPNDSGQDQGGNIYRQNIASCAYSGLIGCKEWYSVKPGDMIGPTKQGVEDLIGKPPRDTFLGVGRYQLEDGTVSDISGALVIAPIWDTCTMAGFCPTGNFPNGTQPQVQVIGFALLFMEKIQGNNVIARLINIAPCGAGGGGGGGAGGGGSDEGGSGVFSIPLRLVRVNPIN
jgi:hypothetical protein